MCVMCIFPFFNNNNEKARNLISIMDMTRIEFEIIDCSINKILVNIILKGLKFIFGLYIEIKRATIKYTLSTTVTLYFTTSIFGIIDSNRSNVNTQPKDIDIKKWQKFYLGSVLISVNTVLINIYFMFGEKYAFDHNLYSTIEIVTIFVYMALSTKFSTIDV